MSNQYAMSEDREIAGVTRVILRDYGTLLISQGEQESLRIEGEPEVLRTVKSWINGGELILDIDESWFQKTWNAVTSAVEGRSLKYHLMVKDLEGIFVQGAAQVKMNGIKTQSLYLTLKGAGEVLITGIEAGLVDIDLPGAGVISASGRTERLNVSVKGAGSFDGPRLESRDAVVNLRGVGKASVWATGTLDASVEGVGAIDYYGNPQVRQQVGGLGKINRRG